MSANLSEFHQIFFEESYEALETMESALLELDIGTPDSDTINTIFRGAHSVKGGSGMFGFSAVTQFTHVLETLLDKIRNGDLHVTQRSIDVLLQAVDCLRAMLEATQAGAPVDAAQSATVQADLEQCLMGAAGPTESVHGSPSRSEGAGESGRADDALVQWSVSFRPHEDMLATANDPLRILRELELLGACVVVADTARLPDFDALDPERCYLAWDITLETAVPRPDIAAIFEWVESEAEICIHAQDEVSAKNTESTAPTLSPVTERSSAVPQMAPSGADAPLRRPRDAAGESSSIRVGIDKLDNVINLVGELVITQSMLRRFGEESAEFDREALCEGLNELERNTRELQQTVMQIRMLPISFSFNRFPRLVRDLSAKLEKQIELSIMGEQTELDKTVLEKIGDPLVHLVRNSLDHGIEMPAERLAAGKSAKGLLSLNAFHAGGNIVIEVKDDGRGLAGDRILAKAKERGLVLPGEDLGEDQIYNLIFQPGFSTVDAVSELSGRGVGMDVVKRNIEDLGGSVDVQSQTGHGCTFTIRLPLTLAILDGQLVSVGTQIFVVSLVSVVESLQVKAENIGGVVGRADLYRLRNEYIPIVRLNELFGIPGGVTALTEGLLVVVEANGTRVGLFVDDLLGQQQVVIKSLETNFRQVRGLAGATILGDGTVAMIIDAPGLIQQVAANQLLARMHGTAPRAA
ncbi:MAG: chemotaxis protein CheA [Dehalococcoidia bacterium]